MLKAADFFDDVQGKMLRGGREAKIDPRMMTLCDVFNPGAAHFGGKYVLAARFQEYAAVQRSLPGRE